MAPLHFKLILNFFSSSRHFNKYTIEEDLEIISYIHNESAYENLKGNVFWKEFEEAAILPGDLSLFIIIIIIS